MTLEEYLQQENHPERGVTVAMDAIVARAVAKVLRSDGYRVVKLAVNTSWGRGSTYYLEVTEELT